MASCGQKQSWNGTDECSQRNKYVNYLHGGLYQVYGGKAVGEDGDLAK